MDALNILRADDYPRCTDYVEDMIRTTEDLIEKENEVSPFIKRKIKSNLGVPRGIMGRNYFSTKN